MESKDLIDLKINDNGEVIVDLKKRMNIPVSYLVVMREKISTLIEEKLPEKVIEFVLNKLEDII